MNKYLKIINTSWQNTFTYRFSLIMWQLEKIILFSGSYLFWLAAYGNNNIIAGYSKSTMLTYVVGVLILKDIILTSRTQQIAAEISTGELSKYLIKPIDYLKWMFTIDCGEKISNIFYLVIKLVLVFILFRPPFFIQTNILYLGLLLLTIVLAILIYFYLSLLISLTTFWYLEDNGWPQRFLFDMMMIFLTGGWFPLDILPKPFFNFLELLPTTYLRYFPLQIYLGRLSIDSIFKSAIIMIFWFFALQKLVNIIWKKGLKTFTAQGI